MPTASLARRTTLLKARIKAERRHSVFARKGPTSLALAAAGLLSSCGESDPAPGASREEGAGLPNSTEAAGLGEVAGQDRLREWEEIDDPSADGWESEVLASQVQARLEHLGQFFLRAEPATSEELAPLLAEDFSGTAFVPAVEVAFQDAGVRVERAVPTAASRKVPAVDAGGFAAAVNAVGRDFRQTGKGAVKFKIVEVGMDDVRPDGAMNFKTHQVVSISGHTAKGVVEHHANWTTRWLKPAGDREAAPVLRSLEVREFERSLTGEAHPRPWLADCTEAVLGQNPSYSAQVLRGMNHWLERIPYRAALNRMGTPGVALGDVNGDGLDDLYLCQEPGLPNLLFLQQPDGRLKDVSAAWGVDWLQDSRSALLSDLDNDGRQDLAVAIFGGVVVAQNMGDRFEIRAVLPAHESTTSLTAADYDRDGRLDLFICAYTPDRTLDADPRAIGPLGGRFVFHDAEDGSPNTFYRNEITAEAGWKFIDVTAATGLDQHNTRWSFAACWDDYDNDGDLDLYVANDYGRNCLYQNETGPDGTVRFRDVAAAAAAEDSASGMSAAWGDYDRDGWMDLYVGNMFSAAGSRVTRQAKFKPELTADLRRTYHHFARGNTLLRNLGRPAEPGFQDTSVSAAVTVGRWAWTSRFADLNNDGWEDLLVANGYITGDEDGGDL